MHLFVIDIFSKCGNSSFCSTVGRPEVWVDLWCISHGFSCWEKELPEYGNEIFTTRPCLHVPFFSRLCNAKQNNVQNGWWTHYGVNGDGLNNGQTEWVTDTFDTMIKSTMLNNGHGLKNVTSKQGLSNFLRSTVTVQIDCRGDKCCECAQKAHTSNSV